MEICNREAVFNNEGGIIMFTHEALKKAKTDLYNIIANHAYNDYARMNLNSTDKRKNSKHIPYSLGYDTLQAQEIYKLAYGKNPEDITEEQEEQIKAFLLPYRIHRLEYLQDRGGNEYYNN